MRRSVNKVLIIVLVVIAILAVAGGVFAYIYLGTDMLKSGQELFAKYFMQNVEELEQTVSFKKLNELEEKLKQSKYEENIEISQSELTAIDPNMKITIDTQKDSTIGKIYSILGLSVKGLEKPIKLEYMQENDMYSLRFTNSVKQFLTIQNSNLKQFATNLGIDEETVAKIPDTINLEQLSLDKLTFSDEEINAEINKYIGVIYNNIPEEKYQKSKDVVITVNAKTITTNAYILTLNTQDIKNLTIKLLEALKQDEIILAKLQLLDEKRYQYIEETTENGNLKDNFVNAIQELTDELKKEEIVEEENFVITVYEEKGKTTRIKLEQGLDYITLDTTNTEGKKQIDIDFTSIDEQNTQLSNKIKLVKESDNKLTIQFSNVNGEEQDNINAEIELIENGNITKLNIILNTKNNQLIFSRNINIVPEINYNVIINSSNNIVLNNLTLEQISNIYKVLGESLINGYVEPMQPLIQPILMLFIMNEAQDSIGDANLPEMENQLFDENFQTYGEENIGR